MDFTLKTYRNLLRTLKQKSYSFIPFIDYVNNSLPSHVSPLKSILILRHDVDRRPQNAFEMAKLEKELGIKGTYYFRIVPESFDEEIIKEIAGLGHEIGYHYEEMDTISSRLGVQRSASELIDNAWELFKSNLDKIRKVAEIKTICPHGSPLSRYDNKMLWEKYNYKELGIIGDARLDTNWDEFAYLTDTGRRWNGDSVSVRDKAPFSVLPPRVRKLRTTFDIINNIDKLPDNIMITIHPERWNNNLFLWTEELVIQNFKNVVKKYFFVNKAK